MPASMYPSSIIFVRRSDEQGHVHLLGKAFSVDDHWLHRLVRCDVDFTHQRIRFYALRRREPEGDVPDVVGT